MEKFKVGEIVLVIPACNENGHAKVVSVGRRNLFLTPHEHYRGEILNWWHCYPNKRGTKLNDDTYTVPKSHCKKLLNPPSTFDA